MKKLIYLILFIPVIGFGQTYPYQIEPDTTHRMIMMTDTSVIDSPALEFVYTSIDSLVRQITKDSLGLDSTYWSLDDSLSLSPINQTNNIILGNLSGNTSLTGSYNFIFGNSLGNNLTTGSYNSIFGGSNLSALTTGNYNTFFGFGNSELITDATESFISGFDNVSLATSLLSSFVNGRVNAVSTTSLRYAFINGKDNGSGIATSLWYSFLNGLDNLENASNGSYVFANGFSNFKNVTNPNYSFANGLSNLGSGSSVSAQYSFFNGRDNALNSSGSVNYSFLNGHDNLRSGIGIDYGFLSGYRNLYQTTSDIQNTIAIGRENGYNAVDHSSSIYLGYRQGYTTGASNKLLIGMAQDDPLIDGSFSADSLRINGTLSIRDKTGTAGNLAGFDGDQIVDSGIDASSVLTSETDEFGAMDFYNVGSTYFFRAEDDLGNGLGDAMSLTPGTNISFVNAGNNLTISATSTPQTLSLSTATLSISSGNSVNLPWYDAGTYVRPSTDLDGVWIPDGLLDKDLQYGNSGQVLSSTGGTSSTAEVDWIDLPTSPWSTGAGDDIYYNTGVHHVGIGTTNPTTELHIVGDALITGNVTTDGSIVMTGTGDVLDFPSAGNIRDAGGSLGTSGDVLTHDGVGVEWMSIDIAQGVRTSSQTFSSTTYSAITGLSSGLAVGGGIVNTNHIAITTSGYYLVTATTTLSRLSGTDVEAYASLYENSTPIGSEMTVAYLAEGEAQTVSTQTYIYLTSADDISLRVKADDSDSIGFSVGAYNTTITAQLIRL